MPRRQMADVGRDVVDAGIVAVGAGDHALGHGDHVALVQLEAVLAHRTLDAVGNDRDYVVTLADYRGTHAPGNYTGHITSSKHCGH